MIHGLLGKKVGMTQLFDEQGLLVPVTIIEAGPCVVTAVRTREKDGYAAVQLGFDEKRPRRTTRALQGHFKAAKTTPKRFVREVPADETAGIEIGQKVDLSVLDGCKKVFVTGVSKGKGFQGVVKRHGFTRGPETHGSKNVRPPGSIGSSTFPARVIKGKRLPGRMGGKRITVHGLRVVQVDKDRNLLVVRGAVPGRDSAYVIIRREK